MYNIIYTVWISFLPITSVHKAPSLSRFFFTRRARALAVKRNLEWASHLGQFFPIKVGELNSNPRDSSQLASYLDSGGGGISSNPAFLVTPPPQIASLPILTPPPHSPLLFYPPPPKLPPPPYSTPLSHTHHPAILYSISLYQLELEHVDVHFRILFPFSRK